MTSTYGKNNGPCAVLVCDLPATTKGLCGPHYGRKRFGNLTDEETLLLSAVRPHGTPRMRCQATACPKDATKTGLCDNHYAQHRYETVTRSVTLVPFGDRQRRISAYVYAFRAAPGWSPPGLLKIGRGTDGRLNGRRTGAGGETSRLHGLACASPGGQFVRKVDTPCAQWIEAQLHRRFRDRHIAGEWFAVTPEEFDVAFAELVCPV